MMAFEIKNLSFDYVSGPVLVDLTTGFEAGRFHALIGPNGAGKSTLIKVLAGLVDPKAGQVYFASKPVNTYTELEKARRMAYMAQHIFLPGGFKASEIVAMARYPYEEGQAETDRAVRAAMIRTGTLDFYDRTIDALSGGEVQRVLLARAFCQETDIMLLDEVTSALDLRVQHRIMEDLKSWTEGGGTVIMVLHDVNLAAAYADRLTLVKEGRVLAQGPTEAVLTPDLLETLYDLPIQVFTNPVSGKIMVTPAPEGKKIR